MPAADQPIEMGKVSLDLSLEAFVHQWQEVLTVLCESDKVPPASGSVTGPVYNMLLRTTGLGRAPVKSKSFVDGVATMSASPSSLIHPSRIPNRWVQLIAGIVAMMAIANLQYAWTLFTKPIQAHLHVSLEAVQWTIVLFVALETWLVPFEGFLVDRIGPRFMLGIGAILAGLGWIGSGRTESLYGLYFWYGLGGIGAGAVYGGTIGNALKWFPDHRGLCVGLTAGAFGIGTATTIAPIAAMLKTSGYQHTFIFWGIVQGVVVLAASLFLARPPEGWTPPNWKEKEAKIRAKVKTSAVDMTPWQMLRQPSFYVIYLMMTMLAFGGHCGHGATQSHGFFLSRG